MTTLTELAQRYLTDKAPAPPELGIDAGHFYTRHYEALFAHLRLEPITLLELGVLYGGSILMWRDWFPNATIVGVDENLGRVTSNVQGEHVHLVEGDATDPGLIGHISDLWGPFNIVIDDCSHEAANTIRSFELLRPHLAPDCLYAVEDLSVGYPYAVRDTMRYGGAIGYFMHLVNWMNSEPAGMSGIERISFFRWLCVLHFGTNE